MVFSGNIFLFFFLPVTLALYFLTPRRFRNALLLVVSLVFYAWGEPVYVFLMIFTIIMNYVCGRGIDACRKKGDSGKKILILSIVLNIMLLGWFKYSGFIVSNLHSIGILKSVDVPSIVLPIGISFYIFQSMSYTIDVYRGEVQAQKNPVTFGCYVSLFPQLIAGPIVRYRDVEKQLECRHENWEQFSAGVLMFIFGLAKKVLLANPMGSLWNSMISSEGTIAAWVGMAAYTLQIYFDFSGYSDMAIGLGKMFGFNFLANFNYPYISESVTDFWRRWHISLSSWFKEYVYIPLGGNRRGLAIQLRNILIVWMLTGLWHGAGWNFVLWGLYYAILLTAEKLFLLKFLKRLPSFVGHIYLLLTVSVGWMMFYFEDMSALTAFLTRLVTSVPTSVRTVSEFCAYLPLLAAAVIGSTPLPAGIASHMKSGKMKNILTILLPAILLLLCIASLATQSYNPFIYFRF